MFNIIKENIMNATHWKNMKQWQFEDELVKSLDNTNEVSKRKHYENFIDEENNEQVTSLWLYYNANGHVGSWQKGKCWVFKENF